MVRKLEVGLDPNIQIGTQLIRSYWVSPRMQSNSGSSVTIIPRMDCLGGQLAPIAQSGKSTFLIRKWALVPIQLGAQGGRGCLGWPLLLQ